MPALIDDAAFDCMEPLAHALGIKLLAAPGRMLQRGAREGA